jgi:hypothetical protein
VELRPAVLLNAASIIYNPAPDVKKYQAHALAGAGVGIGVQHYKLSDGTPFNDYGLNAIAMLNWDIDGAVQARISPVLSLNWMKFVNVGIGYLTGPGEGRTTGQRFFYLTSITYNW